MGWQAEAPTIYDAARAADVGPSTVFVLQGAFFSVDPAESRRIQQSFGDAPLKPDRGDKPDATVEQRRRIIRSLVMAAVPLADAYTEAAHAGQSPSPPGDPA